MSYQKYKNAMVIAEREAEEKGHSQIDFTGHPLEHVQRAHKEFVAEEGDRGWTSDLTGHKFTISSSDNV